jgi:hypothetical protein
VRRVIAAALAISALSTDAMSRPLPRGEISPTPDLIARAKRTLPPGEGDRPDYHFRRYGGLTWVCYYNGVGNSGFCVRTPLSEVKGIDELAEDTCRHGGPDANIPHAMTGEAIVLNYDCKRGHMVREPYANHFDADGWMLEEWKPLK